MLTHASKSAMPASEDIKRSKERTCFKKTRSADFHKHTQKRGNGVDQSFFMHETDGFVNSDDVCTSFFETKLDQNWAIKNDYNHKMREEEALSSPVS